MLRQIIGAIMILIGLFMSVLGPGDGRPQLAAYGKTGILLGMALVILGVLMIKL